MSCLISGTLMKLLFKGLDMVLSTVQHAVKMLKLTVPEWVPT